jgi:hypothetical protein
MRKPTHPRSKKFCSGRDFLMTLPCLFGQKMVRDPNPNNTPGRSTYTIAKKATRVGMPEYTTLFYCSPIGVTQ